MKVMSVMRFTGVMCCDRSRAKRGSTFRELLGLPELICLSGLLELLDRAMVSVTLSTATSVRFPGLIGLLGLSE